MQESRNADRVNDSGSKRRMMSKRNTANHSPTSDKPRKLRHLLADKSEPPIRARMSIKIDEAPPNGIFCSGHRDTLVPVRSKRRDEEPTSMLSDMWRVISSVFCATGSTYYMPEEEYAPYTGSVDEAEQHDTGEVQDIIMQSKAFIESSLEVFDWSKDFASSQLSYSLVFSKQGDYMNDKLLFGLDLAEESQRILKIFLGINREKGLTLDWALKASKKDIYVHTCDVPESPWLAVKSDCVIRQDKYIIMNLMMNDARSSEYDDSMEGYEDLGVLGGDVRVRRYFYKAIWPTSPRDFIMCSSSRELPDGSILMSTISPPSGMYPEKDGYVRAHINISGMHLKPVDKKFGGGCAITMIGHSDLKGNLPSSILNMLSVGMPTKVMTKLKKVLESR